MEKLTLKAFRAQNNMTQKEVARSVGLATSTYNRYEQHPALMPVKVLIRLANLYGVSVGDIFLPEDVHNKLIMSEQNALKQMVENEE